MPIGGIPMVEAALPLGRPLPPAISPVGTRWIADVCGNFGGWLPFSSAELRRRYGSAAVYNAQVADHLSKQVEAGWVLPEDFDSKVEKATRWRNARLPPKIG
jgi:hypothetical protein